MLANAIDNDGNCNWHSCWSSCINSAHRKTRLRIRRESRMQTGMGEEMIKLPEKAIKLSQFEAASLHHSMKQAFEVRKKNKVPTQTIEGKCGLVFTFNFTDAGHVSIDWGEK